YSELLTYSTIYAIIWQYQIIENSYFIGCQRRFCLLRQPIKSTAMKKVIKTGGYGTQEGHTVQITLPNSKLAYAPINSGIHYVAQQKGLKCKIVHFFGACIAGTINERAHQRYPIQIDEKDIQTFIHMVATADET